MNININSSKQTFSPFAKIKVSAMMPALNSAAVMFDLNLSKPHDLRVAVRYVKSCVDRN